MKAAVFKSGGAIGVTAQQLPEPAPGQVRRGVTAAGICGSDLHIKRGS
jgi:threonine dehydrogenase-like Zn-dependent dehydrogenase